MPAPAANIMFDRRVVRGPTCATPLRVTSAPPAPRRCACSHRLHPWYVTSAPVHAPEACYGGSNACRKPHTRRAAHC